MIPRTKKSRIPAVAALLLATFAAVAEPLGKYLATKTDITPESVLEQMNVARAAAGLSPLQIDSRLAGAADDRMQDMTDLAYWAHVAPDGRSPFVWLAPRGYRFTNAGENLATGFETSEILVMAWMESPGHRANILSLVYQHCGIAVIEGSTTRRSVGKSVVVLFARPRAEEVTSSARGD